MCNVHCFICKLPFLTHTVHINLGEGGPKAELQNMADFGQHNSSGEQNQCARGDAALGEVNFEDSVLGAKKIVTPCTLKAPAFQQKVLRYARTPLSWSLYCASKASSQTWKTSILEMQ